MGENCDFEAKGFVPTEIIDKMMEHAKTAHPEEMKKFEGKSQDEIRKMIEPKIKNEN
jgi:predicted small metal-binding protein